MTCPTCSREADKLIPTTCRDIDGAYSADVCAACHESFNRERQIMTKIMMGKRAYSR